MLIRLKMSETISDGRLSYISRNISLDAVITIAREHFKLPEAEIQNICRNEKPEEASYQMLKRWKARYCGTARQLCDILSCARNNGVHIDKSLTEQLLLAAGE